MKMKQGIIAALVFLTLPAFSQKISFFREDLNFRLSNEIFEVDGLYYFRNNTHQEIRQMLFYPFPDVEKFGDIAYIKITTEDDTISMLSTQTTHGALFKLMISAEGEVAYRIKYGQKIKGNAARYIITTTQKWEKPFELANYSIEFPHEVNLDSVSIPPDSIAQKSETTCYYWQRRNFMPVCDFDFFFRK